jgi:hypothetical protein
MDIEDVPKSSLARRNSVGSGLKSVSFALESVTKTQSSQDKLLLSQRSNMSELIKLSNGLQNQVLELRTALDEQTKRLEDLIDG